MVASDLLVITRKTRDEVWDGITYKEVFSSHLAYINQSHCLHHPSLPMMLWSGRVGITPTRLEVDPPPMLRHKPLG